MTPSFPLNAPSLLKPLTASTSIPLVFHWPLSPEVLVKLLYLVHLETVRIVGIWQGGLSPSLTILGLSVTDLTLQQSFQCENWSSCVSMVPGRDWQSSSSGCPSRPHSLPWCLRPPSQDHVYPEDLENVFHLVKQPARSGSFCMICNIRIVSNGLK